jgi:predicted dehydrogenase
MSPIRTGVVGLNHGMEHVAHVLKDERYELVAICDSDPAKLEWMRGAPLSMPNEGTWYQRGRARLLEQIRAYPEELDRVTLLTDYRALLDMPEVEAVILAVPINLNAPLAVRALRAGKHCYASKPFALDVEQGMELLQTVRDSEVSFIHGFQFRYAPLFQQVRRMIEAGYLGQVRQVWWNMNRRPLRPSHSRRVLSGGPYLAECCHWLDLFEFFQPSARFERVAAFGGLDMPNTHVDFADNAVTIIDYDTGVRGSLNFTYFIDQPEMNVFGIQGTEGKIRGDTDAGGHFVMFYGNTEDRIEYVANPLNVYQGHLGFDRIHEVFAYEIASRDHAYSVDEAERGMENLLVCLAADQSLVEGRVIQRSDVSLALAR